MSQLVPFLNYGLEDFEILDESDFFSSGSLLNDKKMFMTLDGIHTYAGVPTKTTPTVTPTTLRNIEQTFIEYQKSEPHENEAGFVPPLVHAIGNNQYVSASDADIYTANKNQNLWQSNLSQSSLSDCDTRSTPPLSLSSAATFTNTTQQTRRNMGGRKPTKDANISPEEEERRRIRRERNKAAAARCRKRRVDHTNALIIETEDLERKRQHMQDEIQRLKEEQEEYRYLLESHSSSGKCRRKSQHPPDIKPFELYTQQLPPEQRVKTELIMEESLNTPDLFISPQRKVMLSTPISKPSRPNSLNVGLTAPQHKDDLSELTGIPISTPSAGMIFNFDSLMGGGTGLTPVSAPLVPSCSTQQRNVPISIADLSSPDACGPPKLVSL